MAPYTCEFCKGEFAKASNLSKHQRTAKYCIGLQQEKSEKNSQLTCEYCNKILSRSDSLHRHSLSCIEYLIHQRILVFQTEIAFLKERIIEKDIYIQKLTERLDTVTNLGLNKTSNTYTHINQITINDSNDANGANATSSTKMDATVYPLAPNSQHDVTELIDKLHKRVVDVFAKKPLMIV